MSQRDEIAQTLYASFGYEDDEGHYAACLNAADALAAAGLLVPIEAVERDELHEIAGAIFEALDSLPFAAPEFQGLHHARIREAADELLTVANGPSELPPGLTAEKLREIAELVENDAEWEAVFPAMTELRAWASFLDTQETPT